MKGRTTRALAAIAAIAVIGAACTSDDDDSADTTAASEETTADTEAPEETTADTEAPEETTADTTEDTVEEVQSDGSRLQAVQDAGVVRCGTRDDLPGFATLDDEGNHVGFDSDFCRAVAAGVLGDATAVEMVDLETADRFTALQSGEIDVLIRNTTWTATRDGAEGATFLQPNFYDGQGMMVGSDSGFTQLSDLDGGAIVCVAQGTTTEGNAAAEAARLGVEWEIRAFENVDLIQEAFLAGQCDGWSSDRSQLTGLRSTYPEGPEALTILDEVFSKEPLGPAVADGDSEWAQAIDWIMFATIQGEEFGITSENIGDFSGTEDITIQRFLGLEVTPDEEGEAPAVLDPGLGLPTDFATQIITQVGNYGEIFDAHLAPLGLERGINALWTDGGLLYAPPYR